MGRWAPGAETRLRLAAIELFAERGYEDTTVAEIAERAGLTARTFFRYFADKREVLFDGSDMLTERFAAAARSAPPDAPPIRVVAAALDEFAALLGDDRGWARRRRAVIDATPELLERELIKLATMSAALAGALRERGVGDLEAALAAETGIAVLRTAFERWTGSQADESLADLMRESLSRLQEFASG
jgi:AcrR family transcriptional regulator